MGHTWLVSRRTGWRAFWGVAGVVVFGAAAVAAIAAFAAAPQVDSAVLVLITVPFLVMAVVLAIEGLGQGLVRLDASGYSTPLGRHRRWADVLAVGTGQLDGRQTPVVALRGGSGVEQDAFPGFVDAEAARLVSALTDRVEPAGFAAVDLGAAHWAAVEAEADRAASVVHAGTGRTPVGRDRIEFGFPGMVDALSLDYGSNDAGERVELIVRQGTTLALTAHGRRWLRQDRKRSADPATQVGLLFGPHTLEVVPTPGGGFDQLRVVAEGRRPLPFNAEEPDRF